jgi:hypothetical protein
MSVKVAALKTILDSISAGRAAGRRRCEEDSECDPVFKYSVSYRLAKPLPGKHTPEILQSLGHSADESRAIGTTTRPTISYECQNKGLTKFAIRN